MSDARQRAETETLAIPSAVRVAVDDRDGTYCRFCGKFLGDRRAHHHVRYGGDDRGMGGRRVHDVDEIITLCWLPGDPLPDVQSCHERVHSDKARFQPLLLEVVLHPGVTVMQLMRWQKAQSREARP